MYKINKTDKIDNELIEEMFNKGVQYGYLKSKRHPSLSSYVFATKNKSDLIDLEKTNTMLLKANEYIEKIASSGKTILFVGTKPEAKEAIKEVAQSLNMPYVIERWIGGTLSNFTEIKKRITELENYHKDNKSGNLEKYTKKERVVLAKKMERLEKYYSGLLTLKKIPDLLFVIDTKKEEIACTEAKKMHVPIVGILNTDSNIKNIDYPIVGNDASTESIKFFTKQLSISYKKGIKINNK